MKRRTFLKGSMTASALVVATGAGLLKPTQVLAAAWPEAAFKAKKVDEVTQALFGGTDAADSKDISIKAPVLPQDTQTVASPARTATRAG